jgi:hypothetical protein
VTLRLSGTVPSTAAGAFASVATATAADATGVSATETNIVGSS